MKKRIVFIFALFLMLTGFNGENRIVEQNGIDTQGRISTEDRAPRIVKHLKDIKVSKGDVAIFKAEVSTSVSSVVWFKNGIEIPMGDWCYSTFKDYVATFVINEVYLEDAGEYSVRFKNENGHVTSTAKLLVTLN